jgi:hypothetical protein
MLAQQSIEFGAETLALSQPSRGEMEEGVRCGLCDVMTLAGLSLPLPQPPHGLLLVATQHPSVSNV